MGADNRETPGPRTAYPHIVRELRSEPYIVRGVAPGRPSDLAQDRCAAGLLATRENERF